MDDFWRPFLFGTAWLVLAVALLALLKRSTQHRLSLQSRLARMLGSILIGLALAIFVSGLPFSLGFCRGGFDDPLTCLMLPVAMVEGIAPLSLLLALAGIVIVPILAVTIGIIEGLTRYQCRARHAI
jgi:hypothetical protein